MLYEVHWTDKVNHTQRSVGYKESHSAMLQWMYLLHHGHLEAVAHYQGVYGDPNWQLKIKGVDYE